MPKSRQVAPVKREIPTSIEDLETQYADVLERIASTNKSRFQVKQASKDSQAAFRDQINEIDSKLSELSDHRDALTMAIRTHKEAEAINLPDLES